MKKEQKGMKMVEYKGNISSAGKMPAPKKAAKGRAMKVGGKKRGCSCGR